MPMVPMGLKAKVSFQNSSFFHLDKFKRFSPTYHDPPSPWNLEPKFEEPSSNLGSTLGPVEGNEIGGPFGSQSPQWHLGPLLRC